MCVCVSDSRVRRYVQVNARIMCTCAHAVACVVLCDVGRREVGEESAECAGAEARTLRCDVRVALHSGRSKVSVCTVNPNSDEMTTPVVRRFREAMCWVWWCVRRAGRAR